MWVEPYPDEALGVPGAYAVPRPATKLREAVELAFVAALQHLPGTQRAVLILREVLAFSAREVAEALQTSVASVNSALQRARATVDARVPERSQQATLRALGEDSVRELVDRYVEAWESCDVEAFTSMLAEEASFAMPPLSSWYRGPRGDRPLGRRLVAVGRLALAGAARRARAPSRRSASTPGARRTAPSGRSR